MYIYMYLCIWGYHTRTYIYIYTRTYTRTCIDISTCANAYTRLCAHVRIRTMHTHTYIRKYIHAYMHTCKHANMQTCKHTCMQTYKHACIHTQTYVHKFIYRQTNRRVGGSWWTARFQLSTPGPCRARERPGQVGICVSDERGGECCAQPKLKLPHYRPPNNPNLDDRVNKLEQHPLVIHVFLCDHIPQHSAGSGNLETVWTSAQASQPPIPEHLRGAVGSVCQNFGHGSTARGVTVWGLHSRNSDSPDEVCVFGFSTTTSQSFGV